MSNRVNARESAGRAICRVSQSTSADTMETTSSDNCQTWIDYLRETWDRYRSIHDEILEVTGPQQIDEQHLLFEPVEKVYLNTMAKLTTLKRNAIQREKSAAQGNCSSNVNDSIVAVPVTPPSYLSKIVLPVFETGYMEWQSFNDIFMALVHNNTNLTAIEKFHYLKTSIAGEAAKLISHIVITNDNYAIAWSALNDRYTNSRVIITVLLDKLFIQHNAIETAESIKTLLDCTSQSLRMLKNLNRPTEHWDDIIVYHITAKLPIETRKAWESSISTSIEPTTWKQLETFLLGRFRTLEATAACSPPLTVPPTNRTLRSAPRNVHATRASQRDQTGCPMCSENHYLFRCINFLNQSIADKYEFVKKQNLCVNCFQTGHSAQTCGSKYRCRYCSECHHSLLHVNQSSCEQVDRVASFNVTHAGVSTILLATAQVFAAGKDGNMHKLAILLDQGSEASLITERAAQLLSLPRNHSNFHISTVGSQGSIKTNGTVQVLLSSTHANTMTVKVNALVLPSIINELPNQPSTAKLLPIFPQPLADPEFHTPKTIDMLIGSDMYSHIIKAEMMKFNNEGLLAQNTIFGWILTGQLPSNDSSTNANTTAFSCHVKVSTENIDNLLRQFWEIADASQHERLNVEQALVEQHYAETHRRLADGRYQVRLPFKTLVSSSAIKFGESLKKAKYQFFQVERRLNSNPELRRQYSEFMEEYIRLGHMSLIPETEIDGPNHDCVYLPHHSVTKESSSTTKVRVVFNASSQTTSGMSLNKSLLIGLTLQCDLTTILLRWRNYKIAFCADIEKMYRQIWVHPNDRDYQRIVWRHDSNKKLGHYRLNTVTYGTSSAPYLAVKTLQQLAKDESNRFPMASRVALNDFYVDDLISGEHDISSARKLQLEIIQMMRAGGMNLRKWSSNHDELLAQVPLSDRECIYIVCVTDRL